MELGGDKFQEYNKGRTDRQKKLLEKRKNGMRWRIKERKKIHFFSRGCENLKIEPYRKRKSKKKLKN